MGESTAWLTGWWFGWQGVALLTLAYLVLWGIVLGYRRLPPEDQAFEPSAEELAFLGAGREGAVRFAVLELLAIGGLRPGSRWSQLLATDGWPVGPGAFTVGTPRPAGPLRCGVVAGVLRGGSWTEVARSVPPAYWKEMASRLARAGLRSRAGLWYAWCGLLLVSYVLYTGWLVQPLLHDLGWITLAGIALIVPALLLSLGLLFALDHPPRGQAWLDSQLAEGFRDSAAWFMLPLALLGALPEPTRDDPAVQLARCFYRQDAARI